MKLNKRHLQTLRFGLPLAILLIAAFFAGWTVQSATNIHPTDKWAWNDSLGWLDFYSTNSVEVKGEKLTGYASSSIGEVSLDCATTPLGNICGTSQYQVCNGDSSGVVCTAAANGQLSGCAWNDDVGWTSFWCGDYDCEGGNICGTSNYRVTIDSNGDFNGYAWNDAAGWISFNCADLGLCGDSSYKVNTTWRAGYISGQIESISFDMEKEGTINSVIWQGTQPSGTCVKFQIGVADSSVGPWTYYGPGQDSLQYFGNSCPGPNTPIKITGTDRAWVNNNRYLRYKIFLESNTLQDQTPTVDSIILNWSP